MKKHIILGIILFVMAWPQQSRAVDFKSVMEEKKTDLESLLREAARSAPATFPPSSTGQPAPAYSTGTAGPATTLPVGENSPAVFPPWHRQDAEKSSQQQQGPDQQFIQQLLEQQFRQNQSPPTGPSDPSAQPTEPSAQQLMLEVQRYIIENSKTTGTFNFQDQDRMRKLVFIRVDDKTDNAMGRYSAHADFTDTESGELINLKFDLWGYGEQFQVLGVTVHSVNGQERGGQGISTLESLMDNFSQTPAVDAGQGGDGTEPVPQDPSGVYQTQWPNR